MTSMVFTRPAKRQFDVFNGDADGLCARQQMYLANPGQTVCISGCRRDYRLFDGIDAQSGDTLRAFDIPYRANQSTLQELLQRGVQVEYFDHHEVEQPLAHPLLSYYRNGVPETCTSLLVDRYLQGRFSPWAVAGAFGDNKTDCAQQLARSIGLDQRETLALRFLGECLNYNAYGGKSSDQSISSLTLSQVMESFSDPFDFMSQTEVFSHIAQQRAEDMRLASARPSIVNSDELYVVILPDAAWARRIIGVFANQLIQVHFNRVCVAMVPNARNGLSVSLRVPESAEMNANQLARRYGGDGRANAAGIDDLPVEEVVHFLRDLQ